MSGREQPVPLAEPWNFMLKEGQVLMGLVLSTSFSEKYKGRRMQAGQTAEVRLPAPGNGSEPKTWVAKLLGRSGNKEAVAFTWLGDESAGDKTLYVAFSPLRYRSQFFKILCSGMVHERLDGATASTTVTARVRLNGRAAAAAAAASSSSAGGGAQALNGRDAGSVIVPISAYIHTKLKRLWKDQGLLAQLCQAADEHQEHRVVFAGISHGAALAQAAALQFQIHRPQTKVYAVTWNAYKWTDEVGAQLMEQLLGERLLPFVLSRRKAGANAVRYWDSVTGFPSTLAPMPNAYLLDADTGCTYKHTQTGEASHLGAHFLMRMFELHFAKAGLIATKKAMASACGRVPGANSFQTESNVASPMLEAVEDTVIEKAEMAAQAAKHLGQLTNQAKLEFSRMNASSRASYHQYQGSSRRRLSGDFDFDRPLVSAACRNPDEGP